MFYSLFYCTLIIVFCLLKHGITKLIFWLWLKSWSICVILKYLNILSPSCRRWSFFTKSAKPTSVLITHHMNPAHAVITHHFMILWSSYYDETHWILILNLKPRKDLGWQHHAFNRIASMPRSEKCSLLLSPTEYLMFFIPSFTAT